MKIPSKKTIKKKYILPLKRNLKKLAFETKFRDASKVIEEVRSKRLTYCGYPKLENICKAIDEVKRNRVAGVYVEAGCALGGSAIVISKCKPLNTPFFVFDVFDMIPAPSERDEMDAHERYDVIKSYQSKGLGEDTYYGYMDNLSKVVEKNLEDFGIDLKAQSIELVKGLFEETLRLDNNVAFAHIDCDWYDSVKICIERITPVLSQGGIMIFDDYSSYSGCKKAVDELLANDAFQLASLERSAVVKKIAS